MNKEDSDQTARAWQFYPGLRCLHMYYDFSHALNISSRCAICINRKNVQFSILDAHGRIPTIFDRGGIL